MRKSNRIVTVTAGRLVFKVCYSQALSSDSPKERAEKSKCSSAARQKMNFRASYQKLQLLIAANFTKHDLYVTLSYADDKYPKDRKESQSNMAWFFRQLRAVRRAAGEELFYVYSTHEMLDDGGRRLHHHLIINAGADRNDYETIRSLWKFGDNIDISPISKTEYYRNDDYLELARYLSRERNPEARVGSVGARGWTPSKNMKKPIRESYMAEDDVTVTAPPGAYILDVDEKQNEYGYYKYIKYLLPARPRFTRKKE